MKIFGFLSRFLGFGQQLPPSQTVTRPDLTAISANTSSSSPIIDRYFTTTNPTLYTLSSASLPAITSSRLPELTTDSYAAVSSSMAAVAMEPHIVHEDMAPRLFDELAIGPLIMQVLKPVVDRFQGQEEGIRSNPLYEQMQQHVRDSIAKQLTGNRFRDAMFHPKQNKHTFKFCFDLNSGNIVYPQEPGQNILICEVIAHAKDNRLQVHEDSARTIYLLLENLTRYPERYPEIAKDTALIVLKALYDLHNGLLISQEMTQETLDGHSIVGVHPRTHEANRLFLAQEITPANMTYIGSMLVPELAIANGEDMVGPYDDTRIVVSSIALDGNGKIISSATSKTQNNSAKGTYYYTDIQNAGSFIDVIYLDSQLFWYDDDTFLKLNRKQQTALRLLYAQAQKKRDLFLANYPHALNVILRTQEGIFIETLFEALLKFKVQKGDSMSRFIFEEEGNYDITEIDTKNTKKVIKLSEAKRKKRGTITITRQGSNIKINLSLNAPQRELEELLSPMLRYLEDIYPRIFCPEKYLPEPLPAQTALI